MDDMRNLMTYRIWAPVYDFVMRPVCGRARRRAIEVLNLQVGERVLIPGIGTGLDLPLIRPGVQITGVDLTPAMLEKARAKAGGRELTLAVMNAQCLEFTDHTFDAVILNLILSVVPDGATAFREAWRVLRTGGRAVIFDKFLPEHSTLSLQRRVVGKVIAALGTDPNRRLSEIIGGTPDAQVTQDEPSLLRGQYRTVLLHKSEQ